VREPPPRLERHVVNARVTPALFSFSAGFFVVFLALTV
jgi:hypothetical protein